MFFGACEQASLPKKRICCVRLRLLCHLICLRNIFFKATVACSKIIPPRSSQRRPSFHIYTFSPQNCSFLYHPIDAHGKLVTKSPSITLAPLCIPLHALESTQLQLPHPLIADLILKPLPPHLHPLSALSCCCHIPPSAHLFCSLFFLIPLFLFAHRILDRQVYSGT